MHKQMVILNSDSGWTLFNEECVCFMCVRFVSLSVCVGVCVCVCVYVIVTEREILSKRVAIRLLVDGGIDNTLFAASASEQEVKSLANTS